MKSLNPSFTPHRSQIPLFTPFLPLPHPILPFSSRRTLTPHHRPISPITFSSVSSSPSNSSQIHPTTSFDPTPTPTATQDDGIPADDVRVLAKFKSRHNYIRVLQVSRRADHPFRGSRLLLLDGPGNIHSISFLYRTLTDTYFDVFATLPPILPPGPVGIFGFGAGSAAKLILELYPDDPVVVHGWELDPAVLDVGREYFGLSKVEKKYTDRLFVYVGNALRASLRDGFSGIVVDLFSNGCLVPELQDRATWAGMKMKLREGGRVMVNVGGSCVEPEDSRKDGRVVMEESLKAMWEVFGGGRGGGVHVLSLGDRKDDSSIALTGPLTDLEAWKNALPRPLRCYADMWVPYDAQL